MALPPPPPRLTAAALSDLSEKQREEKKSADTGLPQQEDEAMANTEASPSHKDAVAAGTKDNHSRASGAANQPEATTQLPPHLAQAAGKAARHQDSPRRSDASAKSQERKETTLPGPPPPSHDRDGAADSSATAATAATAAAASRGKRTNRWSDAVEAKTTTTIVPPSANLSSSDDLSKMSVAEIQRQLELIKQENLMLKSGLAAIAAGTSVYTPALDSVAMTMAEPQLPPEIRALKDRERERREKQKRLQEALRHTEVAAAVTMETMFDADHALRYVPAKRQIAPASAPAPAAAAGFVSAMESGKAEDADYDPFAADLDHESAAVDIASFIKVDHSSAPSSPARSPVKVQGLAAAPPKPPRVVENGSSAVAAPPPAVVAAAAPVVAANAAAAAVVASPAVSVVIPEAKKGFVLIKKNNFLPVKRSVYQPPVKPLPKVEIAAEVVVVAPAAAVPKLADAKALPGTTWACTLISCCTYSQPCMCPWGTV